MTNVYYFCPIPDDATSYYRAGGVFPFIINDDISFTDISNEKEVSWATLAGADILIMQRPYHMHHLNIIQIAKHMNIRVISDFDDDLLNIEQHNPVYLTYKSQAIYTQGIIKLSDEVWVSTENIKKSYADLNDNIFVIPNGHNDFVHPVSNKKLFNKDSKRVAYRGGRTHEVDIYSQLPILTKLINGNKNHEFNFIGSRFPFLETKTGDNHICTDSMTLMEYFNYLHGYNPNIFIYPLTTTSFNRGKSNISWLESTYAGAAYIGNYALPEFRKLPIFYFSDKIQYLFDLPADRLERMNELSWDLIQSEFLLSRINHIRIERLLS